MGLNRKERLDLRVEEKDDVIFVIKASHYARECPDRKDSQRDDDQNPSHGNRRDGKFNSKGKRRVGNRGRGQPFKKDRKSRTY